MLAKCASAIIVLLSNYLKLLIAVMTHKSDAVQKKSVAHRNNVVTKETVAYQGKCVNAICANAIIVQQLEYLNLLVVALTQWSDAVRK